VLERYGFQLNLPLKISVERKDIYSIKSEGFEVHFPHLEQIQCGGWMARWMSGDDTGNVKICGGYLNPGIGIRTSKVHGKYI